MTFLGRGDLAPRRRRRRSGRLLAPLGIVLVVAAGGLAIWRFALHRDRVPEQSCRTVMVTPTPHARVAASASGITIRIINGTDRTGLAHALAPQLDARGFKVVAVGTAVHPALGAPQIVYGDGDEAAARLLAEHVVGATPTPNSALRGVVQLTITDRFTRLATPQEAAAAHTRDLAAASPTPVPSRSCGSR